MLVMPRAFTRGSIAGATHKPPQLVADVIKGALSVCDGLLTNLFVNPGLPRIGPMAVRFVDALKLERLVLHWWPPVVCGVVIVFSK